ncbi:MAG TPA: DNA-formamidopyrimidine glycosylase family protein [Acidimicrobiia bacterium]|nr:DNA-formamidopyrimidine glycosylase family protein [Acidimicrobiia bacterium]
MPELLEIEAYRTLFERRGLGRAIAAVDAPDAWYLKGGVDTRTIRDILVGSRFTAARRHGKLLIADLARRPSIGLRFGMTGRLIIDDREGIDHLEYGSSRAEPAWDRFVVRFTDGGVLRLRDPRRLGGVVVEPDTSRMGVDAATIHVRDVLRILAASRAPLKAVLMDQARIAGLGNLLTDEVLWRAGIAPERAACGLSADEARAVHRTIRRVIDVLGRRGGSHTGDLQPQRHRTGLCPNDGAPLVRSTVGGRTTYSCPVHQV